MVWVGSGGKDARRVRVRYLFRGEGNLFLPPEPADPDLSPAAAQVLAFLKAEGACFTADLQQGLDLPGDALSAGLVELVTSGLVTNDTLQALRQVLDWGGAEPGSERRHLSSLEAELAAWREDHRFAPPSSPRQAGVRSRPSRGRLQAARRTVARRVEATATPGWPGWPGRWSLVHRIGVWGREVPFEERIARQARQLLQCYGIVTRQSLDRDEAGVWDWGALYAQFQLMEMRGEVRRGYFVKGLPGIQFALPEAVERLREWTQSDAPAHDETLLLNATDPANLFGPALPGTQDSEQDPARFVRIPASYSVLLRGRPVLLLESGGERLTTLADLPADTLRRALALAVGHLGRFTLSQWNGGPILDSPHASLLERVGLRREALVYVWDC